MLSRPLRERNRLKKTSHEESWSCLNCWPMSRVSVMVLNEVNRFANLISSSVNLHRMFRNRGFLQPFVCTSLCHPSRRYTWSQSIPRLSRQHYLIFPRRATSHKISHVAIHLLILLSVSPKLYQSQQPIKPFQPSSPKLTPAVCRISQPTISRLN